MATPKKKTRKRGKVSALSLQQALMDTVENEVGTARLARMKAEPLIDIGVALVKLSAEIAEAVNSTPLPQTAQARL